VPLAQGAPGNGYPWPWSIYKWLDGDIATHARVTDLPRFAAALAEFLVALQQIDTTGGPLPGPHNFYRGAPPAVYDEETRRTIAALDGEIDARAATAVWETALQSTWQRAPVWIHGDVAVNNLLLQDGRLCAVLDFGSSGVGDPACDLVIAWTYFAGPSRETFRAAMPADQATWARGRGWALWKALITLAAHRHTNPTAAAHALHVINEVIADHCQVT
jgi:aminoglycoside phosphotransferase (APT) family kinase protein